jgi:phenylacetate-CoA ligase
MPDPFDALETRPPEQREEEQFERLRAQLADAQARARGPAGGFGDLDAQAVTDRAALAGLPVLRKADLAERQRAAPPFGGLAVEGLRHAFMSPGPIFEPGGDGPDWWRFGRALHAAGLRRGMLVHNCFAYHLTPAGMMFENGARAVGARVFPGGVGNTEAQVEAAAHLRPEAWTGTPDFLKVILDKARDLGADLSSIGLALVSGGALFPSLRREYAERGVRCLQCYGAADLGLIAYETASADGPHEGMVVDEGVILEILRPGTDQPAPEGEVGEVVATALNPDYPLLRFATGDLSAFMPGPSPCGRTGPRIRGWMGRADQTAKIKGLFVRPEQIAEIARRHQEIAKARLSIHRVAQHDAFTLSVEADTQDAAFRDRVAESVKAVLRLSGRVEIVARGELPNDGKVIDDRRDPA